MSKIDKKFFKAVPYFILIAYSSVLIFLLFLSIFTDYPRELRDATNVHLADMFAHMQNPYKVDSATNIIANINVYTPLNMMIAALVYNITKIPIHTIFYGLDFTYIVVSACLLSTFIYKKKHSLFVALLVFSSSLTLGWRLGFISTIPDHLGMLIIILLLLSVANNGSILWQSLLTIVAFYSKQYFLAVSATIIIYYLLKSRKLALKYFCYTCILGICSLICLNMIFPLFSIETLLFMFKENKDITFEEICYSIQQMMLVFIVYGFFTLFTLVKYGKQIYIYIKKKQISCLLLSVFDVNNIVMFFLLLYLGQNKGAFLSYHLTLLTPSLIITGSLEISNYLTQITEKKKTVFLWIISTLSVFLLLKKYQLPYIYTAEDKQQYVQIESFLGKYDQSKLFLTHQLGYYAMQNKCPLNENGHEAYIVSLAESKIIRTPIDISDYANSFPKLSALYSYALTQKEMVTENIKNQTYEVILRSNGEKTLYGYDISQQYKYISSYSIRTGTQKNTVDVWIPLAQY